MRISTHWLRLAVLTLAAGIAGGCASSGQVHIVSLTPTAIDPPDTTVYRFSVVDCTWWKSADNDLMVAMSCKRPAPIPFVKDAILKLSFALQGMPAGNGKNYRVARREIRGLLQAGMQNNRFVSYQGIVGVTIKEDKVMGSFRLWIIHQPGPSLFNLFPQTPGQLLFSGNFIARPDKRGTGHAIMAETESDGWERNSPAATAPVQH